MASQPQAGQFTVLGQRYGHPRFGRDPLMEADVEADHTVLGTQPPLKSGLTPLIPDINGIDQDFRTYHIQTGYQRNRFRLFSARELDVSGAWAPTRIGDEYKILPESIPIHPLFQRSRWEVTPLPLHEGALALQQGRNGFFLASNNIVWNAILPALRLASMYITHPQTLQWWYALLYGEYSDIDIADLEFGTTTERVHKSIEFWTPEHEAKLHPDIFDKVQKKFKEISEDIEYHMASGCLDPLTGLRVPTFYNDGITTGCLTNMNTKVNIASELIEPLLSKQLTTAERMINIHSVASCLVHETAHACWIRVAAEHGSNIFAEPFFSGEVFNELGYSLQNGAFGGIHENFVPEIETISKGLPVAGYDEIPWNVELAEGLAQPAKRKLKPTTYDCSTMFPIHLDSFFNHQHSNFWQYYVPKFGTQGAHMQKTPVGLVLDLTTGNRKSLMKDPGNYKSLDQLIIDNSKMTTAEISSATLENSRRQKARDIYNQIKQDVADLNWIKVPPNSEYIPIPDTQIRGDFNKKLPDPYCPRFAEIVDYVHATRDVHSWDTFHFETPEHVLYAHIRRHGVLIISPEEWRDFLIFCSNKNGLFNYDYVGGPPTPHLGFVSRNPRGWPSTPIELNFSPPTDFDELCFIQGMKRFGQRSEFFEYFRTKDHNDFDKEIMRNEINICLTYKRVKYNGNKLRGFLAPLAFDQCIAECQRLGDDSWCFGPPGIIRKNVNWDIKKWE